jgi:hypothetical protein
MPKPFIDYLPEWLGQIDLTDRTNYSYAYAVQVFNRIQEAKAMFPQARDFGNWVVTDKLACEPERRFPCWRNSEFPRWTPDVSELFPRVHERMDFNPIVMRGLTYWRFRFSVGVSVLESYAPLAPEVKAERAERRKERERQAEIESMPLFQIDIRAEQEKERP